MSMLYHLDPSRHASYIVGKGTVEPEEFVLTVQRLAADPGFHPTMRLLADFSAADLSRLGSAQLEAVASASPYALEARCAVVRSGMVAAGASLEFAFFMQVHGRNSHRFYVSRTEALQFLNDGLPESNHMSVPPWSASERGWSDRLKDL